MAALAKRKKTIMQDIDSAQELRSDAETRLKGYQRQLGRIEERRKELHAEYRSQFEAEKTRLLADARERGIRLRKDAELRVQQELKQAEADLLREAVEGAMSSAAEILAKGVQDSDQDRLADEYLSGLAAAVKNADSPARLQSGRGA
jgi:F-type H+-transporting ATPase subunit b